MTTSIIYFTEAQLSFLFNNLESEILDQVKKHAWYVMMDSVCWDEEGQVFRAEHPIFLRKEQADEFYTDMIVDSEIILSQLGLDVRYNTLNDASWSNSRWCLEQIASILDTIRNAKVIGD